MNPSTLYLVQSSYHSTPKIIDELHNLFQVGDQIVLWVMQLHTFLLK